MSRLLRMNRHACVRGETRIYEDILFEMFTNPCVYVFISSVLLLAFFIFLTFSFEFSMSHEEPKEKRNDIALGYSSRINIALGWEDE